MTKVWPKRTARDTNVQSAEKYSSYLDIGADFEGKERCFSLSFSLITDADSPLRGVRLIRKLAVSIATMEDRGACATVAKVMRASDQGRARRSHQICETKGRLACAAVRLRWTREERKDLREMQRKHENG